VGVHETSFDPMDGGALVSIGMPVYNGAIYLQRAIQSVLGQNYSNLELMIKAARVSPPGDNLEPRSDLTASQSRPTLTYALSCSLNAYNYLRPNLISKISLAFAGRQQTIDLVHARLVRANSHRQ
jgi:hypothetical protein